MYSILVYWYTRMYSILVSWYTQHTRVDGWVSILSYLGAGWNVSRTYSLLFLPAAMLWNIQRYFFRIALSFQIIIQVWLLRQNCVCFDIITLWECCWGKQVGD